MSIYNLMSAVRSGEFEEKFKICKTLEDKINLFKEYGISISLEQYKRIENEVMAIKSGAESAYDIFKKQQNPKNKLESIDDFELSKASAGTNSNAVYETLINLSCLPQEQVQKNQDEDVKLWKGGGFLTGRGLF